MFPTTVSLLFTTLKSCSQLRVSTSTAHGGEIYQATGRAVIREERAGVLRFEESGEARASGEAAMLFRNLQRWLTLGPHSFRIEHLRAGPALPTFLLDLALQNSGEWRFNFPHRCGEDLYTAALAIDAGAIRLRWQVIGPKKNHTIDLTYSSPEGASLEKEDKAHRLP